MLQGFSRLIAWYKSYQGAKHFAYFTRWYDAHIAAEDWTAMRCPLCQHPAQSPDSRFCSMCGHDLHSSFATEPMVIVPASTATVQSDVQSFCDDMALRDEVRRQVSQALALNDGERHTDRIDRRPILAYLENKRAHPEWGDHTQIMHAIKKHEEGK